MSTSDRPSPYQISVLRGAGCRVRPRDYGSAKRRIDGLPPSENQVALLTELGLEIPETRTAASEAITAYELEHPAWARARRAERTAKGRATLIERRSAGAVPQFNETLLRYHAAGVKRFGALAASPSALSYLRALALQLPRDSAERLAEFKALDEGLSAQEAGTRIDRLKARPRG